MLIRIKEHPFPHEELKLIERFRKSGFIDKEDVATISHLLSKYLDLRANIIESGSMISEEIDKNEVSK